MYTYTYSESADGSRTHILLTWYSAAVAHCNLIAVIN